MRAAEMAADAGYGPDKIYWSAVPRSALEAGLEEFRDSDDNPFGDARTVDDLPFGTPDDEISARIDAREHQERKRAAMLAHVTQIPPTSWLVSLAGDFGNGFLGVEHYVLVHGKKGTGDGPYGWESDLFAGIE